MSGLLPDSTWQPILDYLAGKGVALICPGGPGDQLIHTATKQLFSRNGIRWVELPTTSQFIDGNIDVVCWGGGGNMGPMYQACVAARKRLLDAGRPVAILPQTWTGLDPMVAASGVPPLPWSKVWAREEVSPLLAPPGEVSVLPDLAFAFDLAAFEAMHECSPVTTPTCELGIWLRSDREAPQHLQSLPFADSVHGCSDVFMYLARAARCAEIWTNRLHFAIAGLLVGRKVTLLPNSYFKNRAVWEFSLRHLGCAWSQNLPHDVIERNGAQ